MEIGNDLLGAEIDRLTTPLLPTIEQRKQLRGLGVFYAAYPPEQHFYTCDLFVFWALLHEPWMNPTLNFQLINNSHNYLLYQGFRPTSQPHERDVAIYRRLAPFLDPTNGRRYLPGPKVLHYGAVTSDGKVLSKWGEGSAYLHDKAAVPLIYGDTVNFYTKEQSVILRAILKLLTTPSVRKFDQLRYQREIHYVAEHPDKRESYLDAKSKILRGIKPY